MFIIKGFPVCRNKWWKMILHLTDQKLEISTGNGIREAFRILLNSYDRAIYKNSERLLAPNYFHKKFSS